MAVVMNVVRVRDVRVERFWFTDACVRPVCVLFQYLFSFVLCAVLLLFTAKFVANNPLHRQFEVAMDLKLSLNNLSSDRFNSGLVL